ncbi:MAG: ABC transporter substrate-binding protein, partial [Planctomycetales bacterium]|nr:ABC transporter substrate-binding protein [Planctomycetales bacterium]
MTTQGSVSHPQRISKFITILLFLPILAGCAAPVAAPDGGDTETATVASDATAAVTISHALGETEISGTPQRIVALEWTYVEDLLALGIQPVAVADIQGYNDWVDIPVALADDVVEVGTRQEPNLEKLAELRPDLIIAPAFRVAETYAQLSEIAPTVAFDPYPTDESVTQYAEMRQTFLTIADLVGRAAEGEAVLAQMEAKFAAARSQLEAAGKLGEPFVLAQAFGGDTVQIRLFTDNAMAVEIVEQLGLENAWQDATFQQYGFTTVSVEALPELGDVNFFYVVQDDNNVFTREAIAPLWNELAFVQSGNAYALGGDTWLFGGPLSAELVVDKVMEALTGAAVTVEGATFPVTIEHKYGSTTITEKPARIVTVGLTDQDAVLALGVTPVGTTTWIGDYPGAVFPWAADRVQGELPEIVGDASALSFETIAALDPDVILALYTGITEDDYALLSAIAPTVAPPAGYVDYGLP